MSVILERRGYTWLLLCACGLLTVAACSNDREPLTVVPDAPVGGVSTTVSSLSVDTTAEVGVSVPAVPTSIPDSTVAEAPATTLPAADEPTNPVNVYALAGAQVIAARANESDLSGLDADGIAEALLEAIDAAYEIEYPTVVTYLDVTQDDDANLVVVTEDESQTQVGTAYVCIVGGKAIASERTCTTAGN